MLTAALHRCLRMRGVLYIDANFRYAGDLLDCLTCIADYRRIVGGRERMLKRTLPSSVVATSRTIPASRMLSPRRLLRTLARAASMRT